MWIAILYSISSTILILKIGKPLIKLNLLQESLEANFRYNLIKLKEKKQEIAIEGKEIKELKTLKKSFEKISKNYTKIILQNLHINSWQNILTNLSSVIPLLI